MGGMGCQVDAVASVREWSDVVSLDDEAELFDAIDGLMAYDYGAVDSGIHDEVLRARVIEKLQAVAADGRSEHQLYSRAFSELVGRFIQQFCISKEALDRGYNFEDLVDVVEWIQKQMEM
jgi:hypothetical protein